MKENNLNDKFNFRDELYIAKSDIPYIEVLDRVQRYVLDIIRNLDENKDIDDFNEESMKHRIMNAIVDNELKCDLTDKLNVLVDYIYHDMVGYSFISREKIFEDDAFEEMNIDSWKNVWIKKSGGYYQKSEYSFNSHEHLLNTLSRMFQHTSSPFNQGTPYITTDIGGSIRITAYREPIVDNQIGASVSIRKVSGASITKEILIQNTITKEMLDFLLLSAKSGIAQCYGGETGSGKTTLTGFIIREVAKTKRVFTIEEGAREWDLYLRDETGEVLNSVVHTRTKPNNSDDRRNINQNQLLQGALRFDPDLIGVGEMRSDEAFSAIEASNTGHPVITTVHSGSAVDSLGRLMTLAKKAFEFQDHTLMKMIADAFPLQVYMELFPDGSRRVTEIVEIIGYKNDELTYKTLYDYYVEDNITDPDTGKIIEIKGAFRKLNYISDKLHQKMLRKGSTRKQLEPFYHNQSSGD